MSQTIFRIYLKAAVFQERLGEELGPERHTFLPKLIALCDMWQSRTCGHRQRSFYRGLYGGPTNVYQKELQDWPAVCGFRGNCREIVESGHSRSCFGKRTMLQRSVWTLLQRKQHAHKWSPWRMFWQIFGRHQCWLTRQTIPELYPNLNFLDIDKVIVVLHLNSQ